MLKNLIVMSQYIDNTQSIFNRLHEIDGTVVESIRVAILFARFGSPADFGYVVH